MSEEQIAQILARSEQCPTWTEVKMVLDILDARLRILEGMIGV